MNKPLIFSLLACVLVAGCAGTSGKDAPIEERAGAGEVVSSAGATGATASQVAATEAQAATSGAGQGQVETRALPGGQAMDATGIAGSGALGDGKDPLKDPGSILSKRTIFFDFDSAAIRDEFRPLIEAHAQYLRGNNQAKTILQGHTDERGSREYNLALGQRRAESVQQAMALLGVADAQIEAVSMGEEKPIDEGHDESAWQQNRRVEIHYHGE